MKLKDLLACAATGMILCTSCIKNEAPNAEADILNCTLPEGILTDAIINYNAPFDGEINAYPLRLEVHNGTDLTQLAPTFELTPGATITSQWKHTELHPSGTLRGNFGRWSMASHLLCQYTISKSRKHSHFLSFRKRAAGYLQ